MAHDEAYYDAVFAGVSGELTSSNKDAFSKVFDQLKKEIISDFDTLPGLADSLKKELKEYYDTCLTYTVVGGKMTRGLCVVRGVEVLKGRALSKQEYFEASVLGWNVEWLQAFFLVADDIMDGSTTRRDQPCWYKVPTVTQDNGINDALFLENLLYKNLKKHFKGKHPAYLNFIELYLDATNNTEIGQHIDTNGTLYADGKRGPLDLTRFTIERYKGQVQYKTSYYSFYLSCALALTYCGFTETDNAELYKITNDITMRLGEYFQVQDDVLDAYAPPEVLGKIGTDIEDAKCSWLVCKALEIISETNDAAKKQVLIDNYGKHEKANVDAVKTLYKQLNMEELFHAYEEEQKKALDALIATVEPKSFQDLFNFLLGKIYKRQK